VSEENPYALAERAATLLLEQFGVAKLDAAIVLGSGWREGAVALGTPEAVVKTSLLPGFVAPTVPGHDGSILLVRVGEKNVALVSGRVHLYEGNSAHAVVHPIRTVIFAGASSVVLTNAAGGLDSMLGPGSIVLLRDHINLTATSPLEGAVPPEIYGQRFVDLSDLYDASLRESVKHVVPTISEGVYAGVRGPHYETPAEIKMLRTMGASLVGMSTVLEAIAARHMRANVLGLSLVTNFAAGVTDEPLDHEEVLAAGKAAQRSLGALLQRVAPLL
jgi:purine-nucleoside phosphorylase